MRSKDTLLRLHRFRSEGKRRQVTEIEMMIADFRRKQDDLDLQINAEEERSGVTDPNHFKYSMTAKSIRGRRDNLLKSIEELDAQLAEAREQAEAEEADLRKVELLVEKEGNIPQVIMPIGADDGTHVR